MNKFNMGQIVVCINNNNEAGLTLEKQYTVLSVDETTVTVQDDYGDTIAFAQRRFEMSND